MTELPEAPLECEECVKFGGYWVHLRMCLACGKVGCCDNSPNRHASAHFQEAGHPLIRSAEPHEDWLWCLVDRSRSSTARSLALGYPGAERRSPPRGDRRAPLGPGQLHLDQGGEQIIERAPPTHCYSSPRAPGRCRRRRGHTGGRERDSCCRRAATLADRGHLAVVLATVGQTPTGARRWAAVRYASLDPRGAENASVRLVPGALRPAQRLDAGNALRRLHPAGKAPWHYHLYDEIVWVPEGPGRLHIGDDADELGPGSAFRLRPRQVHIVENASADHELTIIGIFTPPGARPPRTSTPDVAAEYRFAG